MTRSIGLSLLAALLATASIFGASVAAGPTQGGMASDNVEYVGFVPFETGTATGAALVGKFLYVTGWRSFSIYDVSDPAQPQLESITPIGFMFENEDVATDGEILLFSEEAPRGVLHVWDVEDETNPVEVATVDGAGNHTQTCILGCKYSYGSDGAIVDLREPAKAKLLGNWQKKLGVQGKIHDVDEFRPGYIVTSPYEGPIQLVDVRDPVHPKVVVSGAPPELYSEPTRVGAAIHATRWPHGGRDRYMMGQGGSNVFQARCDSEARNFWTFDASRWESDGVLRLVDEYTAGNETPDEGSYPASTCSTHWFEPHPRFRNGGLVALAYYDMGTRFLEVRDNGKIREAGWFLPYGGVTSATYWRTPEIVYAIDYGRGFDILRFKPKD